MVTPTNSLILLLPASLFHPSLLPLFKAHFSSYGSMVLWTPLEKLGRVLVAYEEVAEATEARAEMDGFIWSEEGEDGGQGDEGTPLRAFFGPSIQLPLPPLHQTLLAVPALSRNFLISPPGSPPVGWEQTLEEAPNSNPLPTGTDGEDGGWAEELARALRFLSTDAGGEEDAVPQQDDAPTVAGTTLLVPSSSTTSHTSITVSTPPTSGSRSPAPSAAPPPEARNIGQVKATIESMLGRKRSYSDLRRSRGSSISSLGDVGVPTPSFSLGNGGALGGGAGFKITPTARPPLAGESSYHDS